MKDDDLVDLLRKNEWELNRIKVHHKDMKPGLLNKLLKDAGLK